MRRPTAREHVVAAGVPVTVVDRLEVVDIRDDHGDVLAARRAWWRSSARRAAAPRG